MWREEKEKAEEGGSVTMVEVKFVTCVWVEDTELGVVSSDPPGTNSVWEFAEVVVALASLFIN